MSPLSIVAVVVGLTIWSVHLGSLAWWLWKRKQQRTPTTPDELNRELSGPVSGWGTWGEQQDDFT